MIVTNGFSVADIDCETDPRWTRKMCPRKAARQKRLKDRKAAENARKEAQKAAAAYMRQLKAEKAQLLADIAAQS